MVKSKEDSCSGLLTTSKTIMASKRCPIFKTFSSASNTTLNAHIDQCPSIDSPLPPVSSKPYKPRAKPQKKVRTMVDIYASSKACTLEDLDHRNKVVTDKSQVSKKRSFGPVYVDAKGQKLRNLSDFSDTKTSTRLSREQHRRGLSGEGSSTGHRRIYNQRMLAKCSVVSKKLNKKGHKCYALCDQPSENDDDSMVLRGTDLSATESYPLKKQKLRSEDESLEGVHTNTLPLKKSLASIQEDKSDDMVYRQAAICKEDVRFDSEVEQGSLFVEVYDTIPIPEPSRSFIPSPWDIGFDENVGNSSVITSQVQSSMDQLDRNSSESPVSKFASCRLSFPVGPNQPYMIQQDLNLQSKFTSRTTCPSNSVLRLMGKDLMVMNHGEEAEGAYRSSLRQTPQLLNTVNFNFLTL